jgi:hypothetical protein
VAGPIVGWAEYRVRLRESADGEHGRARSRPRRHGVAEKPQEIVTGTDGGRRLEDDARDVPAEDVIRPRVRSTLREDAILYDELESAESSRTEEPPERSPR